MVKNIVNYEMHESSMFRDTGTFKWRIEINDNIFLL